jgi:phage shock protein PspC (stress-responsive transcriptional regulator)
MENKRLYRSQKNSVIAGVCGGLADYFNVDPILIRGLFIVAILAGGGGVLVYIVLWIITPVEAGVFSRPVENKSATNEESVKEEFKSEYMEEQKKPKNDGSLWGGIILIALGAMFLVDRFIKDIDFGDLWPLILVVVGVILISKSIQKK